MKNHLTSLFNRDNRMFTLSYFVLAVIMISTSLIIGTSGNLIGICSLLTGVCFLFYTLLHTWKSSRSYARLAWICTIIIVVIISVTYLLSATGHEKYLNEGLIMFILFLSCLPGIIVGILGAIFKD